MNETSFIASNDSLALTQCVACGGKSLACFGGRLGYLYAECTKCKTLQLNPMPYEESLAKAYREQYSQAGHYANDPAIRNKAAARVFTALADTFEMYAPNPRGATLDYGCGWGGLLDELRQRGIPCEGADFSMEMANYTRNNGFTIYSDALEQLEGANVYDGIFMSAVFEHLIDYPAKFYALHRMLKPDGVFITLQPTAHFARFFATLFRFGNRNLPLPQLHEVICPPWHTVLFTIEGMRQIAAHNGFELIAVMPGPVQSGSGAIGFIKDALHSINKIGWPVFGQYWPLCICHIFVMRRLLL